METMVKTLEQGSKIAQSFGGRAAIRKCPILHRLMLGVQIAREQGEERMMEKYSIMMEHYSARKENPVDNKKVRLENQYEKLAGVADEFSQICGLSGYVKRDLPVLEYHKDLLNRTQEIVEASSVVSERHLQQQYIQPIIQGTNKMALSYLGVGRSEYGDLREGVMRALDFLEYLFLRFEGERFPIAYALGFICRDLEMRNDNEGLLKLQETITSCLCAGDMEYQTEVHEKLTKILSKIGRSDSNASSTKNENQI